MDCADVVSSIFSGESHHKNFSVIYIGQNLFYAHKDMRSVHLNCHYLILFKCLRDMSSISVLARQMFPGNARFLRNVFADATRLPHSYLLIDFKESRFLRNVFADTTRLPHSYLLIDFKQSTPDCLRLRTNTFPAKKTYVYVKR